VLVPNRSCRFFGVCQRAGVLLLKTWCCFLCVPCLSRPQPFNGINLTWSWRWRRSRHRSTASELHACPELKTIQRRWSAYLKPTLFYSQQQLSLTAPLQIARDLRSISDILVLLTSNIVAFCPWSVSWLLCFLDTGSKEFPCSSRRLLPFPMQVWKI